MTAATAPELLQARESTSRKKHDTLNTPLAPTPANHRSNRTSTIDPLSDRATQALIRKVLLPQESSNKVRNSQRPIDALLPPLTSRNDVDLQLYAFLAIILREFVQAWYGKITPDEAFVAEIIRVIAHCTRALEQRIRQMDLENVILNEIPDILSRHITTYRSSHHYQVIQYEVNSREAYHTLWPLPPLSPVPMTGDPITTAKQLQNETAYRQLLVQAVLSILLPTDDLENPCLTTLAGQIFSELIIGNVIANKAAQPWLLFEAICMTERIVRETRENGDESTASPSLKSHGSNPRRRSVQGFFVSIIQFVMLFISSVRFAFNLITITSSLPTRAVAANDRKRPRSSLLRNEGPQKDPPAQKKVPVLSFNAWSCLGSVIEIQARMPWLSGFLSLVQLGAIHGPGRFAKLDGALDRLLSHKIQLLFSASHVPLILRALRGSLFPNNAPGSSSLHPPSSDLELRALRRQAAQALWNLMPASIGRMFFGGGLWAAIGNADPDKEEDEGLDELEGLVGVLDDEYCNKHLMYSVLELILVRLMPELEESSVEELLQERLGWHDRT
ncbi:hypothetical protein QQS21_012100 [Conoideocrella luteorostrata]|uniref:PXA domain-containing protein n=1 Tax=Conoideocrella luteorostrata TaxID=1105319 RepID=A0AAJ0CEN7_9HYPO|nr:hypothetical protein QQS21_012100 [Conoideocrella luteorostrata]